ncbi:MamI family restriction endonuclease [Endozoicomonas sp. ONNA2]|uniref:MamI family restriction endonuclease n=1 Tax=Endozoicomonas sp. ONNA2 TaxID=2828741 RepID=UPI0021489B4D|nr:MamI family restriction endonuclease [Endozoicomonas sp. ONNA2]
MGQKLNNDVLTLLNMHYNAYCKVRKYADKYKHPHPTDTRGWSQIIVSALTGILGYERRKGPDLEDGSDVKAANCWDAIDTPRFNGCIKAGTHASTANSMLSLDEMPNLFFVMWDQSEATRQYRCRVWVVNTQTDPEFRKMAKRWYDQRASGVITSDNFQLQPPRNKDNNIFNNKCGCLEYPLMLEARVSNDKYVLIKYEPDAQIKGLCRTI